MFIMRVDVVAGRIGNRHHLRPQSRQHGRAKLVHQTQGVIAMILYFAGMALSVFASAGLVSAVFEQGRIELLLSKPVSRTHLLLGRYVGQRSRRRSEYSLSRRGLLDHLRRKDRSMGRRISAFQPVHDLHLLRASAVIVLVGVLWDSAAIAIMATFAIMIVTPILAQKSTIERLLSSECSRDVVRVLYYALPKTSDVSVIIWSLIMNQPVESWMPVWSTALFGAVVLGLGLWRFDRRSF